MNRVSSNTARSAHLKFRPTGFESRNEQGLLFPNDDVEPARNNRPVVLLHGTLVEKEGIEAFREFALRSGHPVSHQTYSSITKGARIEESSDLASREINFSRAEVAAQNVAALSSLDRPALQQAFQLAPDLYGSHDSSVDIILDKLPHLLQSVQDLLNGPQEEIGSLLSGRLMRLETDFTKQLESAGVERRKARGAAREVLDTIAPKAVVIGHSAGGFVAHNLVVNPETRPDDDPFTYDGGNGIAEALILSSPIEKGLSKPAPPGVSELPFYNFEKSVLRPVEKLPGSQLMLMNPLMNALYQANKSWLKSLSAANFMLSASLTSPLTYLARPGNQQVEEGSEFFQTYMKDKPIPDGVSVITFTSPLDRLSLEDRSALDTEERNGHAFSVKLDVSPEDLQRERPTWSHVLMAERPDLFKDQFAQALSTDPERLSRLLSPANDEGVRHEALSLLQQAGTLEDFPEMRKPLEQVAAEELPFEDSASYLAHQLLQS